MEFIIEDKVKDLVIKIIWLEINNIDNITSNKEFDNWRKQQNKNEIILK